MGRGVKKGDSKIKSSVAPFDQQTVRRRKKGECPLRLNEACCDRTRYWKPIHAIGARRVLLRVAEDPRWRDRSADRHDAGIGASATSHIGSLTHNYRDPAGETGIYETNFWDVATWAIDHPGGKAPVCLDVVCFETAFSFVRAWSIWSNA